MDLEIPDFKKLIDFHSIIKNVEKLFKDFLVTKQKEFVQT
jgi:hypothetical protein